MVIDCGAPRGTDLGDADTDESVAALTGRRPAPVRVIDEGGVDAVVEEVFELPDADLSGSELRVRVLPRQADGFCRDRRTGSCVRAVSWPITVPVWRCRRAG